MLPELTTGPNDLFCLDSSSAILQIWTGRNPTDKGMYVMDKASTLRLPYPTISVWQHPNG